MMIMVLRNLNRVEKGPNSGKSRSMGSSDIKDNGERLVEMLMGRQLVIGKIILGRRKSINMHYIG